MPHSCLAHVYQNSIPVCRLEEGFTWDALLSVVGDLRLSYRLLRGFWPIDLGAAAARLQLAAGARGSRIKHLWSFTSTNGHNMTMVCGILGSFKRKGRCSALCSACTECLVAEKVSV